MINAYLVHAGGQTLLCACARMANGMKAFTGPSLERAGYALEMRRSPVSIVVFLLSFTGCPEKQAAPVATECTKPYEQCLLPPNGPLGVCNPTDCVPGQPKPCLKCVGQH